MTNPFAFLIDDILYTPGGVWVREIFQYVDDHPYPESTCGSCQTYPGATNESMTVDGIHSSRYSEDDYYAVHVNPIMELRGAHIEALCRFCHGVASSTGVSMRWAPRYPILRFTSEGLQTEEVANV